MKDNKVSGTVKNAAAVHKPDLERLEHLALALAQSEIQNALNDAGLKRAELAAIIERPRSYITKILSGDHNLTVRTMARVLGACGFESRFGRHPIEVHLGGLGAKGGRELEGASDADTGARSSGRRDVGAPSVVKRRER